MEIFYFNGMGESDQNAMPESHWQAGIKSLKPKQELHCCWETGCWSVTQQRQVNLERLQTGRQLFGL